MTLYGAAVTPYPNSGRGHADEVLAHEADCGKLQILRTYDGGAPATWASVSTANGSRTAAVPGWRTRSSWHSMKPDVAALASGALDGWVRDYLYSIPETGHVRMLTIQHEPKGRVAAGAFTAEQWASAQIRFGNVVRDVQHPDVLFGPCFAAQWDLTGTGNVDTLTARREDLLSVWDFVGWDPYNEATKTGDFTKTAGYYLDPLVAWMQANAMGLPMAIGETGFIGNPADPFARSRWLREVVDYAAEYDFSAVCYFDASVTNPWYLRRFPDGSADLTSGRAWGINYQT
jgi:hypothetical protein